MIERSSSKSSVAQKDHKCFGCRGSIRRGDRYERYCVFEPGKAYTVRLCPKCWYASGWLNAGDTFCEGELKEDHQHLPPDCAERFDDFIKREGRL